MEVRKVTEYVTTMVLIYRYGNLSVFVYPIDTKSILKFAINSIKSKKEVVAKLNLNLPNKGTLSERKARLLKHHNSMIKKYQQFKIEDETSLIVYFSQDLCKHDVDAIAFLDMETVYIAVGSERYLAIGSLKPNSVSIEVNCILLKKYDAD